MDPSLMLPRAEAPPPNAPLLPTCAEYRGPTPEGGQWVLLEPGLGAERPAALAANSPEYLVLPEPLRPKQLHHLHTWPSQGQTQALQGSPGRKPQWMFNWNLASGDHLFYSVLFP